MPNMCMRGRFTLLHTQNSSLEERARRCRHTAGAWLPPLHAGSSQTARVLLPVTCMDLMHAIDHGRAGRAGAQP